MDGPLLLRRYLADAHLSQAAFAARLKVSGAAVSLWASGTALPAAGSALLLQSATAGAVPFSAWFHPDGTRRQPAPLKRKRQRSRPKRAA